MAFIVKIKNIGKLADAEIRIGDFTVLAGPNNTGKSFVSKLLYSLFNAMNANHAETHINNLVKPIYRDLNWLKRPAQQVRSDDVTSWLYSLEIEVEKLGTLVKEASIDEFDKEDTISDLISQMENIEKIAADIPQFLSSKKMTERRQIYLNNLTNSLVKLKEKLHQTNAEKFIVAGIEYEIRQNLIRNFQVPNFSDLKGTGRTPSEVEVEGFAKFALLDEAVGFDIDSCWITQ